MENLPYTRTDEEANKIITSIIEEFNTLARKAESLGYPIKLHVNSSESLCLYYHDDYPDMILVDKYDDASYDINHTK